MTCGEVRELLSALLDGALTGEEETAVSGHLAGCPECRREREGLAATLSLLHRVAPERAPAGFVDRVLDAARPRPWYERLGLWRAWLTRPGLPLGAVAMLLVAGLSVYIFQRSPDLQQAARQEAPVAVTAETPRPEPPAAGAPPASGTAPPSAGFGDARRTEPMAPAKPPPAERANAPGAGEPRVAGKEEAARARDQAAPATDVTSRVVPPAVKEEAAPGRKGADLGQAAPGEPRAGGAAREVEGKVIPQERRDAEGPGAVAPSAAPARQAPAMPPAAAPREKAASDTARQALASRAPSAPEALAQVTGRLAVADRAAGLRALADLAARIGATAPGRGREADESRVELSVSREAYPALVEGLGRIGRWTPEREATPLPETVRVSIRLSP